MEWQPVETAPKDNTEILVWNGDSVNMCTWCIVDYTRKGESIFGWGIPWSDCQYIDKQPIHIEDVTHWMPLPDGPK